MSETGVGEDITGVASYTADFDSYKEGVVEMATQYRNLHDVVQQKIGYAQQLEQRMLFFYYAANLVNIDPEGVDQVMSAIAKANASAAPGDADTAGVTFWDVGWGIVQGVAGIFLLKFTVLNYLELAGNVRRHNQTVADDRALQQQNVAQVLAGEDPGLGTAARAARNLVQPLRQELELRTMNAGVAGTGATGQGEAPAPRDQPGDDEDARLNPVVRNIETRADEQVGPAEQRVIDDADALDAAVNTNAVLTLNNCRLLPKALAGSFGAAAMWFIGDLVSGVISGDAQKADVEKAIDDLVTYADQISSGLTQMEAYHTQVVDYVNTLLGQLNALVSYLSTTAFPVAYVGPSWATLSAWTASTADGRIESTTVHFSSADDLDDWSGPSSVPLNTYQAGWQWQTAAAYAAYLSFADAAAAAYGFVAKIRQWQASYTRAGGNPAPVFHSIPDGAPVTGSGSVTDPASGSYNEAFAQFITAAQSLFGGAGSPITEKVLVAGWNASLLYAYDVSDVQWTGTPPAPLGSAPAAAPANPS
jgi:hypothetical protein